MPANPPPRPRDSGTGRDRYDPAWLAPSADNAPSGYETPDTSGAGFDGFRAGYANRPAEGPADAPGEGEANWFDRDGFAAGGTPTPAPRPAPPQPGPDPGGIDWFGTGRGPEPPPRAYDSPTSEQPVYRLGPADPDQRYGAEPAAERGYDRRDDADPFADLRAPEPRGARPAPHYPDSVEYDGDSRYGGGWAPADRPAYPEEPRTGYGAAPRETYPAAPEPAPYDPPRPYEPDPYSRAPEPYERVPEPYEPRQAHDPSQPYPPPEPAAPRGPAGPGFDPEPTRYEPEPTAGYGASPGYGMPDAPPVAGPWDAPGGPRPAGEVSTDAAPAPVPPDRLAAGVNALVALVLFGALLFGGRLDRPLALAACVLVQVAFVAALVLGTRRPGPVVVAAVGLGAGLVADAYAGFGAAVSLAPFGYVLAGGLLAGAAGQLARGGDRTRVTDSLASTMYAVIGAVAVPSAVMLTRHEHGVGALTTLLGAAAAGVVVARLIDMFWHTPRASAPVARGVIGVVAGGVLAATAVGYAAGVATGLPALESAVTGLVMGLAAVLSDIGVSFGSSGTELSGEPVHRLPARFALGPAFAVTAAAPVGYVLGWLVLLPRA